MMGAINDIECMSDSLILQATLVFKETKLNSVACSPQANYTDRAAAACQRS
jgi:hypothetical protein